MSRDIDDKKKFFVDQIVTQFKDSRDVLELIGAGKVTDRNLTISGYIIEALGETSKQVPIPIISNFMSVIHKGAQVANESALAYDAKKKFSIIETVTDNQMKEFADKIASDSFSSDKFETLGDTALKIVAEVAVGKIISSLGKADLKVISPQDYLTKFEKAARDPGLLSSYKNQKGLLYKTSDGREVTADGFLSSSGVIYNGKQYAMNDKFEKYGSIKVDTLPEGYKLVTELPSKTRSFTGLKTMAQNLFSNKDTRNLDFSLKSNDTNDLSGGELNFRDIMQKEASIITRDATRDFKVRNKHEDFVDLDDSRDYKPKDFIDGAMLSDAQRDKFQSYKDKLQEIKSSTPQDKKAELDKAFKSLDNITNSVSQRQLAYAMLGLRHNFKELGLLKDHKFNIDFNQFSNAANGLEQEQEALGDNKDLLKEKIIENFKLTKTQLKKIGEGKILDSKLTAGGAMIEGAGEALGQIPIPIITNVASIVQGAAQLKHNSLLQQCAKVKSDVLQNFNDELIADFANKIATSSAYADYDHANPLTTFDDQTISKVADIAMAKIVAGAGKYNFTDVSHLESIVRNSSDDNLSMAFGNLGAKKSAAEGFLAEGGIIVHGEKYVKDKNSLQYGFREADSIPSNYKRLEEFQAQNPDLKVRDDNVVEVTASSYERDLDSITQLQNDAQQVVENSSKFSVRIGGKILGAVGKFKSLLNSTSDHTDSSEQLPLKPCNIQNTSSNGPKIPCELQGLIKELNKENILKDLSITNVNESEVKSTTHKGGIAKTEEHTL